MPIFGSRKRAVTWSKNTKPSSADRRLIIITSREEGRNFILPRELEYTAEPKAGGMFANGLQRVRFAEDHEEARCPMCAGNGIYHNNTPQPAAPSLFVVPPALLPPQHPIPCYPPYNYVGNNTGALYGAAAAAPPAPIIPLQQPIPVNPHHYYVANNTGVGNYPDYRKQRWDAGRYYVWEETMTATGAAFGVTIAQESALGKIRTCRLEETYEDGEENKVT